MGLQRLHHLSSKGCEATSRYATEERCTNIYWSTTTLRWICFVKFVACNIHTKYNFSQSWNEVFKLQNWGLKLNACSFWTQANYGFSLLWSLAKYRTSTFVCTYLNLLILITTKIKDGSNNGLTDLILPLSELGDFGLLQG